MDHLAAISAFVHVVEAGSLAAASRRMGVSPAAVSRAITALEMRLGTPLLQRTTRSLRITSEGSAYLATCRRVLAELDAAERGIASIRDVPSGLLTITAPAVFGRRGVRPLLDDFLVANDRVAVRLLLLERFVNLVDEGVDVAIRVGHLPDSDLLATRLGELRRIVCASPEHLARHGTPQTPAALARHACISPTDAHGRVTWSFAQPARRGAKQLQQVTLRPRLAVNEAWPAVDSAVEGRGFARMLSYQVVPELQDGRLRIVLAAFEPPPTPVHLVFARSHGETAKLRHFVAFAVPRLRSALEAASRVVAEATNAAS